MACEFAFELSDAPVTWVPQMNVRLVTEK